MATIENAARKAFGLDEAGWQRHTNPWSVYTRIPIPALLAPAISSRAGLGWLYRDVAS